MAAPSLNGIVESALFVRDLGKARAFYEGVLGLTAFSESDTGCGFQVAPGQLLLLVTETKAHKPSHTPGGTVPACVESTEDALGAGHVAFAVDGTAVDGWRDYLEERRVEVLSEVTWDRGGRSLYFRDPDGHVLELASPGVWDVY